MKAINKVDQTISQAEWEVMRVVWAQNQTTSKKIIEVLESKMSWKPATIKTLIGRLTRKGLLDTEKNGRQFLYSPTLAESEATIEAGESFLDQICKTKVGSTLASLIENCELSQDDIKQIQDILLTKQKTAPEHIVCNCIPGQCNCHNH